MIVEASSDVYIVLYSVVFNILPIITIVLLYSALILKAKGVAKRRLNASDRNKGGIIPSRTISTGHRHNGKIALNCIKLCFGNPGGGANVRTGSEDTIQTLSQSCAGAGHVETENSLGRLRAPQSLAPVTPQMLPKRNHHLEGIRTLGVLVVAVTLLWLPLSVGMLTFVAIHDFR